MGQAGKLVKSTTNNLGIGKIIQVQELSATVEYFGSIAHRITKEIPLASLTTVNKLSPQTRCYIYLEDEEKWLIGRVEMWDEDRNQYIVNLPDKNLNYFPEEIIYIRCNLPIKDPIEILQVKGQETAYFHEKRLDCFRFFIEQRAKSRGMTALISANIEFYPHQIEVIRRILEDPIQRYLLADEVGLGKTIEASVILYQYLLDQPQGKALILVPEHLIYQWQQELTTKVYLSRFSERWTILGFNQWQDITNDNYDFVIIDEAHNIASMAKSNIIEQKKCYQTYQKLAHNSSHLLLLSATPVLNHEADFLAMLNLLDPLNYSLDSLESFKSKIEKRQEIGQILLGLNDNIKPFVLKQKIKKIKTIFSEDYYLISLVEKIENILNTNEPKQPEISKIIRTIRNHISDIYRLHRRMLRNRREVVEDVIFQRNIVPKTEYHLDDRCYQIHELLDEWRKSAPLERNYQKIFRILFLASSTWLGLLKQVISIRLKQENNRNLINEFGQEYFNYLILTPLFLQEEEILHSLLEIIENNDDNNLDIYSTERLGLLQICLNFYLADILELQSLKNKPEKLAETIRSRVERPFGKDKLPKIIIFTSYTLVAEKIIQFLQEKFGKDAITSHCLKLSNNLKESSINHSEEIENNLAKFKNDPRCFLLVCDKSGEEGRNLQFVDGIIHFDLPWNPNRLEQRLGRVDRIGGKMQVKSWLLAGVDLPDSLQSAWYELLKNGFGIFNQSIASLQFYVDDKLTELEEILFKEGYQGLLEQINIIKEEISQEKIKINEQNSLDEIDALEENAQAFFTTLDDYDANHKQMEIAIEKWICHCLDFKKVYDPNFHDFRSYKWTKHTLVPYQDIIKYFSEGAGEIGTYNRRKANQNTEGKLYRIGNQFMDDLFAYLSWDDRGKAFAIWRYYNMWSDNQGDELLGFRLDYVIEANLKFVEEQLDNSEFNYLKNKISKQALQRQADSLFPPFIKTIFIDAQTLEIVEDDNLLTILELPFSKKLKYLQNLSENQSLNFSDKNISNDLKTEKNKSENDQLKAQSLSNIRTKSENLDNISNLTNDLSTPSYRDFNLTKNKLSLIEQFIDPNKWISLCQKVRETSEISLRENKSFIQLCQQLINDALKKQENRLTQLELRLNKSREIDNYNSSELIQDLALQKLINEGLIEGMKHCKISPDSVGFILISGRTPELDIAEIEDKY